MTPSGGTPLSPEEERAASQDVQLRDVVAEAFRLLPTGAGGMTGAGAGQGEGIAPRDVDSVVRTLSDLRRVTGGDRVPALDWLSTGLATAPPGDGGDLTTAAMRVRDLLLELAVPLGDGQPDFATESEDSTRAAEQFATKTAQVVDQ